MSAVWICDNRPGQQWAHLSIPKCACTSIRRALEKHLDLVPAENVHGREWPPIHTMSDYTTTWAVIRNPFDRLLSVWAEKCQGPSPKPGLSDQFAPLFGKPFDEFADAICHAIQRGDDIDPHVRPMVWFLEWEPDYLIPMDRLGELWRILRQRWGLPGLPRLNTSEHGTIADIRSGTRRLISTTYEQDIVRLFPYLKLVGQ